MTDPRRRIPSVDQLLASPEMEEVIGTWGRGRSAGALRAVQGEVRAELEGGGGAPAGIEDPAWYAERAGAYLTTASRPSLRRVLNATGVVLHTNLGRAPLAEAARVAVAEAAGYAALEMSLETGSRGSRYDHCVGLLRELTGAEGAIVVNNNAAAVVLAVNTIAAGREVIVSRGELVEIGGSFRVPDIIERSGARLREVGSTNRTHARDYEDALGPSTGALLRVHRSNFRVEGFTTEVPAADLAALGGKAGIPFIHDAGSGLLLDLSAFGVTDEPTAREALAAGADMVTMSGDKLLGGPQAGIILGRADLIAALRSNPLNRALRPDKLTLAALEATLDLYRDPERAWRDVPVLRMLALKPDELEERAARLAGALGQVGASAAVVADTSPVGGGALPGLELPTAVVTVTPGPEGSEELARRLRMGEPAVVARVREDRLLLDLRTLRVDEEAEVVEAVRRALAGAGSA